jgi:hypothetical protein
MNRNELFPSKYLRAADLPLPLVVTIASVTQEDFQNDGETRTKPVIQFREHVKALVVNMTNFDAIADIAGTDETTRWRGIQVELFADKVRFRGKSVDSVRVRAPDQGQLQTNGGGEPPRRPQAATRSQPAPQPRPIHDDFGDETPWTD